MYRIFIFFIRIYQKFISGMKWGSTCRFSPSCSQYAIEAFQAHGTIKGLMLSVWRILRCNPFGKVGYDPVPEKGSWKNPERHIWRE